MWVRLPTKPKPNSCTEHWKVNAAGIREKERVSTRGDLADGGEKKPAVTTNCEKSAEVIVP